jgi:hypothetical protein
MSKETIRTNTGRVLGYIEDTSSGKAASSHLGRRLGEWSRSSNRTTSNTGRVISEGNTLASLVTEEARKNGIA